MDQNNSNRQRIQMVYLEGDDRRFVNIKLRHLGVRGNSESFTVLLSTLRLLQFAKYRRLPSGEANSKWFRL